MKVQIPWGITGHKPGDVVDLPDDEAKNLLRVGLVRKPAKGKRTPNVSRDELTPSTPEMGENEPPTPNNTEEG